MVNFMNIKTEIGLTNKKLKTMLYIQGINSMYKINR